MPKQSKKLGISKACPNCRKTILKNANMKGEGIFLTRCPHCKTLVEIDISQKTNINLTKII